MSAQTFDEWWATHYNTNERDKIMCREAWHSRDAEVAELKAKLTETERLNKVALEAMKEASSCAYNEAPAYITGPILEKAITELELK